MMTNQSLFLAFALLSATTIAFQPNFLARNAFVVKSTNNDIPPQQTVTDLNLEEMFEVFEAADTTISSSQVAKTISVKKFDPSKEVGSSSPFNFFDPAGFSLDMTEDQFKLYQEAEIKHGRVAMIAFLGIVFGESFSFLFDGTISGPAIYQFQQIYTSELPRLWIAILWGIAMIEGQTIISVWQPLEETMMEPLGIAKLRPAHTAGDLKFDPLGLKPKDKTKLNNMRVKEINNGRLAMIGVAGIVVQELITNTPIF
eukprot:gene4492-6348_t